MRALIRALRRSGRSRWIMLEAVLQLYLVRWAIRLVPFRWLTWYFARPAATPTLSGAARLVARKRVAWAVQVVANDLSGEFNCFPKAVATQAMLRRRHVATVLYYGAATLPGQGLTGHVWLQDDQEMIVGHFVPGRYRVLASYPDRPAEVIS